MSDIVIGAIKPELIDITWPKLEPHIQIAIEESNGELDIDEMKECMKGGTLLPIVIYLNGEIISVCTIERREFSSGKVVLHVSTLGGTKMDMWDDKLNEVIAVLAKEQGCNEIYMIGRKGWERYLKTKGYSHIHTVMSRKLEV